MKHSEKLIFCLIGLFWALPLCVYSQNKLEELTSKELNQVQVDLEPFIQEQLPKVTEAFPEGNVIALQQLFTYEIKDTNRLSKANKELLKARIAKAKTDFGLNLRADYLENLQEGVFDMQDGGFYRRRGQVGLNWDILGGGLVESNFEAKALEEQLAIQERQSGQNNKDQAYSRLFNTIIVTFNELKREKLQRRKKILKQRLKIERLLFKNDLLLWDKVVETLSRKNETANMLKNYEQYNQNAPDGISAIPGPEELPVVDIKLDKVLEDLRNDAEQDSVIKHTEKMLEYRHHPVKEMRLSPYFRYNLYNNPNRYTLEDGTTTPYRNFLSFGISFSTPIKFDYEENQKLIEAQLNKLRAQQSSSSYNKVKEALNSYYEFQYALSDYIEFYHKRAKLLEKIRQEEARAKIGDGSYSPVALLKLMDELASVNFEIFDIQQRMYLKLLDVYDKVDEQDITEITRVLEMGEVLKRYNTQKGLYIWSDGFEKMDNEGLIQFLSKHEIQKVALSTGPDEKLLDKAREFTAKAREEEIEVQLMIGNNHLIFQDRKTEIDDFIATAQSLGVNGIHLDVEPHVLESFDLQKQAYLKKWVDMVRYTRKQIGETDLKLSVSIPIWYEKAIFDAVEDECDQIFIMAYSKQDDVDALKKRLVQKLGVNKDKTVVALRADDFDSPKALTDTINELKDATQINDYAIHQLESLLKLHNQGMEKK